MNNEETDFGGPQVKVNSIWKPRTKENPNVPYRVLSSDYDGVVATTSVRLETCVEDSFIWMGPLEDWMNQFACISKE